MIYDTVNREVISFANMHLKRLAHIAYPVVLDIGCATGILGRTLKKNHKISIHGIELDKGAMDIARRHYDHLYPLDLETIIRNEVKLESVLDSQKFDLVIFGDVLE